MDNNKKGINDIGSKMFNYLKEKLTASEEKDLWSSGNSGEDKGIIFQFKKYREAAKEVLTQSDIEDLAQSLSKAFIDYEKTEVYKKIRRGCFSFSGANSDKELESNNIKSLINCYCSESKNDGTCGYVSILKACGSKKNSGSEYSRFFKILEEYKAALEDSLKLDKIDKWRKQISGDDYALIVSLLTVVCKKIDTKDIEGKKFDKPKCLAVLERVSIYIKENQEKIEAGSGLLDNKDLVDIAKNLLSGLKGLAKEYSNLLNKNYQNCETKEGTGNLGAISNLPFIDNLHAIYKFYPVTINKYDIGVDYATLRYAYQQAFTGHGLTANTKDSSDAIISLFLDDLDKLIPGDLSEANVPQSDDGLKKDVKINYQGKNYEVQYKKCENGKPTWLEFEYLMGLSKSINKPVFCLSSNPECAGLFVFDASRINEKYNSEHICKFIFSMKCDLKEFDNNKIQYYAKLANEYSTALEDNKNPVLFFSSYEDSGHYTYLDPNDKELRKIFAKDIKEAFFNRYIAEEKMRDVESKRSILFKLSNQRGYQLTDQKNKVESLQKELEETKAKLKKEEEIENISNKQNDREQKLNEKEKVLNEKETNLKEKQDSLEKSANNLKIKTEELNKKEQNITERENKLQAEEKKLANKEKGIKERENLQNELEALKKTSEKKVNELNLEVQTLKSKNSEQEKQISILKLKDNDEKLNQMTKKVDELTSQLANQNKEFETKKQQLDEKCGLENKLTSENNQLKEQAKTQEQLLIKRQTKIQELTEQNQELQKKLESTNVLSRSGQLQQEQKETGDVNEKKELHIKLIIEYLENIKVSNTNTILYIFAWIFQWASDTCKSYIEKAAYEKKLASNFEQLKRNLKANGGNIVNDDGQLIEDTLTTLDSFMLKCCDDDMRKKLANLYSELLNFHKHDTENIIKAFREISNGEKYIELIGKNSIAKAYQQNIKESVINGGNNINKYK